jgi:hypothetical protein
VTILNRKLKRDLWQTKGMLTAVILIVAVGVSCLVGMMGTSRNLQMARNIYYGQCRMADFWIDLKKMPTTELNVLDDLNGISEIRSRIAFQVSGFTDPATPWRGSCRQRHNTIPSPCLTTCDVASNPMAFLPLPP